MLKMVMKNITFREADHMGLGPLDAKYIGLAYKLQLLPSQRQLHRYKPSQLGSKLHLLEKTKVAKLSEKCTQFSPPLSKQI
jgi:hypothetical protein